MEKEEERRENVRNNAEKRHGKCNCSGRFVRAHEDREAARKSERENDGCKRVNGSRRRIFYQLFPSLSRLLKKGRREISGKKT